MPEVNADRPEDTARACGCGPAMREMAAACCGEPERSERTGSEEQETTPEQGGA